MSKRPIGPELRAAALAAKFARAIGLPPGNMWEPPIARHIAKDMIERPSEIAEIEAEWAFKLGMQIAIARSRKAVSR